VRRSLLHWSAVALLLGLTACKSAPPDGLYYCKESTDCPGGQRCYETICRSIDPLAGLRGGAPSASEAAGDGSQSMETGGTGAPPDEPSDEPAPPSDDAAAAGRDAVRMAGRGGTAGSGTAGAAGRRAGASGAGAAAPAAGAGTMPPPVEPKLGAPCGNPNARGCDGYASRQALRCDGTTWQTATACSETQRCARGSGVCQDAVVGCEREGQRVCVPNSEAGAFGDGTSAVTCGMDLLTAEDVTVCNEGTPYCEQGECTDSTCVQAPPGNLLENSDFDSNVSGWLIGQGATATRSNEDATKCSRSGSVALRGPTDVYGAMHQCLTNISQGQMFRLSGRVRAMGGTEEPIMIEQQWQGSNCDGQGNGGAGTDVYSHAALDGEWHEIYVFSNINPGTKSLDIILVPSSTETLFDQVYLAPEAPP
jgi:hypothetical protein